MPVPKINKNKKIKKPRNIWVIKPITKIKESKKIYKRNPKEKPIE